MHPIPELLAPAGSPEAFWAGYEAGADAFYLGAPDFNARKRAKNFTLEEIEQTVAFAHQNSRKIYLTLNTLVFDSEIPALTDLLLFADQAGVDAIIMQDLGVLSLVRSHFPRMRVHASTQLFCHNSLQARFLKDAGVSRIVLPREMTIEEIGLIADAVPLEYEVFIHGALCFSFSGCCLFSSYRFGASGNRGECKQVCRLPFGNGPERSYPFSMKDLNGAPVLQELLGKRPAALKIEGRLKNAEYVSTTVSFYRQLLDTYERTGRVPRLRETLKGQRAFSTGYFVRGAYESLTAPDSLGTLGEKAGSAFIPENGLVTIIPKIPLSKGMRLRLMDTQGRVACEGTLLHFSTFKGKREDKVQWRLREAQTSDQTHTVYLLGSMQPPDPRRTLRHAFAFHRTTPLYLKVRHENDVLLVHASAEPYVHDCLFSFPLTLEAARGEQKENALSAAVSKIFCEVDRYPFSIKVLDVVMPAERFCPPRLLKEIRRTVFQELFDAWNKMHEAKKKELKTAILEALNEIQKREKSERLPDIDGKKTFQTPLFIPETKVEDWKKTATSLIKHKVIVASTYGQLSLLHHGPEVKIYSGQYVYCSNSFAYDFLTSKGANACVLPPDIDNNTLGLLAQYKSAVRMRELARELFVTRLQIPKKSYALGKDRFAVVSNREYDVLVESGL
ncbi:MAG: hypothetical protein A2268_04520 [Candidatus Raymondbacteria bacterium RifOxyA12_full_50_37]|uniref:Peptidase U32 collagenase domain-containing protein n=1 Tax=Candidatus Raymondbacteria bacterium RIFOXYD12_FULL_49_13 TaxID=1817890 RepID=A0A1F7FB60_UNCRA|nr:MAG: hypothetical protein A2268_04520 [Candidatus Raymondbacteria bacterium RifOxyA12_full_50_37]OGJ88822.1 MAG: hypothetical protein A2350_01355 [Candidatus Raymondbacteria bacterium RifOxyB12_full_50_8]OGJ92516.1 MAG: hypothetical protein A2248_05430 [Candidatus Raymondbacteria bacterium RIFOXYA2_FULL_49_16]OGJ97740.1 MAG: hypothetical protein A2487_13345 [Candidatus Raymondbacteria bacterium RifOxyC12_full_50_8]OGJ97870.1 MAG: hypothetical protein A2453_02455 [Candidatus Raymondbacteria b